MSLKKDIEMKIRNITSAILITCATLAGTSCYRQEAKNTATTRRALLEELMLNNSQSELNNINRSLPIGDAEFAVLQHKIDSIAFNNILQGNQKANDSAFVKEYNKLIALTQPPLQYSCDLPNSKTVNFDKLNEKLASILTVKEYKDINNNPILPENGGNGYFGTGKQFLLDSTAYYKLFKDFGILNDSTLGVCEEACNKVRP